MSTTAPGGAAGGVRSRGEEGTDPPFPHPGGAPVEDPPDRRGRRRRRAVLLVPTLVLLAGAVAAGAALTGRAGLAVARVEVTGVARVPADEVRAAARGELGRPLLLADLDAVAAGVRALPAVRDVTVTRRWPSTLAVTVVERRVLAGVPAGDSVRLVDEDGVELAVVGVAQARAAGAPLVRVDPGAGAATLRAAAAVQRQLPGPVRDLVREVSAATPDTVRLTLVDASQVLWGSAQDGGAKASGLLALRRRTPGGDGVTYDVSAPGVPAVAVRPADR